MLPLKRRIDNDRRLEQLQRQIKELRIEQVQIQQQIDNIQRQTFVFDRFNVRIECGVEVEFLREGGSYQEEVLLPRYLRRESQLQTIGASRLYEHRII